MGMDEKVGGLPSFDNDILNFFFLSFFLPTAEIATQPMGKINANLPTAEGLGVTFFSFLWGFHINPFSTTRRYKRHQKQGQGEGFG